MSEWTAYHAKYFAHELSRRASGGIERLSHSLFDAAVDLNPHQIEAALFALRSPLSKGVILADEVGLGKTIEAGIVLCQLWAERKRRLLVICPASLRKQWALELSEKFALPSVVLDSKTRRDFQREGRDPFDGGAIVILSFPYANRLKSSLRAVPWDLVVIDEAHTLRNAYRPTNKIGQGIRWATEDRRKLLLTATPLQNSLLEIYGLATLIDERLFGGLNSFRSQYMGGGKDLGELRSRLLSFTKRTLRRQVTEYVNYTERRPITQPFKPTDEEHALYHAVSAFLQRTDSYAFPQRQRHLSALILRKLLASSSHAIAATLDKLVLRLEQMKESALSSSTDELTTAFIEDEEMDPELLDEPWEEGEDEPVEEEASVDLIKLEAEISELKALAGLARSIGVDTKSRTLLRALEIGLSQMEEMGAPKKALIFTESRKTQDFLREYLESNGYAGKVVLFNGTNQDAAARAIHEAWLAKKGNTQRASSSRDIDVRTALIEHFRDEGTILIATEAAAEGINLQFCSLVVNYDLPWNPQRIEQRIGRCHRYGQRHDVVVINFLNERNEADRRVFELLSEKFRLFDGIFGASDEVLGSIESGVDFEKRILAIYQSCRTQEEIEKAFADLREELEETIRARLLDTQKQLLEHFDEDVHERLRLQLTDARLQLDKMGKRFWALARYALAPFAAFDKDTLSLHLQRPPLPDIPLGRYHLFSKSRPQDGAEPNAFLLRLGHPLGEYALHAGKEAEAPLAHLTFDVSGYEGRIHVVEELHGQSGVLCLQRLAIESFDRQEHLLFVGLDDEGNTLDPETMAKLFSCKARSAPIPPLSSAVAKRLAAEAERACQATISRALEENSSHFHEARERLERWAEDRMRDAEKELEDTKEKIKALRRQARQAMTLQEQHAIQEQIRQLESRQRRQRKEIFQVEDEIAAERDALIDSLEQRLSQRTMSEPLFTIRWTVA